MSPRPLTLWGPSPFGSLAVDPGVWAVQVPHAATALPKADWEQQWPWCQWPVWRVVWLQGRGCAAPLSAQKGRWWPGSIAQLVTL